MGFIHLVPEGESVRVNVLLLPTVTGEHRERFAAWISEKIDRFFEHGAEPGVPVRPYVQASKRDVWT